MSQRRTIAEIIEKKNKGEKIVMLTAYDYPTAQMLDQAGVDIILIGDSVSNVVLGRDATKDVSMAEMMHHAKAVSPGTEKALVVADMPYLSFQSQVKTIIDNGTRFIEEAKCQAVKIEWFKGCLDIIEALIQDGIPVMGHVGLTPQTADQLGGLKVQGKDVDSALKIITQAKELEKRGCFAMVLECIPDKIADIITKELKIPTIGIGAGHFCDGQVLVTHDILGLVQDFQPKFVKKYVDLRKQIIGALEFFSRDVREGQFPTAEQSFHIKDDVLKDIQSQLKAKK